MRFCHSKSPTKPRCIQLRRFQLICHVMKNEQQNCRKSLMGNIEVKKTKRLSKKKMKRCSWQGCERDSGKARVEVLRYRQTRYAQVRGGQASTSGFNPVGRGRHSLSVNGVNCLFVTVFQNLELELHFQLF